MQYSHSRVECHISCPYKYKLRYVDKLKTIPAPEADNALICGNTIHLGAEKNLQEAISWYHSNYPIINDRHIEEVIKFEYLIPKIHELLDGINVYKKEFKINTSRFIGIVDLITKNEDGTVDVFDYKYSNNYEKYSKSPQLHLYKYFLEQIGFKVRKLGFIFIPKISIKQKKQESLYQFRKRIQEELNSSKIKIMEVKYDASKVIEYMDSIINITEDTEFKKIPTNLCHWCDYENYCLRGIDYEILNLKEIKDMQLPSTERRDIKKAKKRKIWIYGPAFSGKTTMLDDAPNPLNLNTDGNVQFVTMPYIAIKDEVTVNGRITNRKYAWEVFKDTISELEKKQNNFNTIIVDLLEDTREMCRLYKYNEMGITHESDGGFGKGWDIIKTEYLSTIRRLFNLDYENIVVLSHEDVSKDITKKNGQNVTRIAPNIQEAISNKVAGMVDIVARVIVDGDERTLNFKSDEVIFGGGRLKGISKTSIPLSWDELMKVYDEANAGKKDVPKIEEKSSRRSKKSEEVKDETSVEESTQGESEDKHRRRGRKEKTPSEETKKDEVPTDITPKVDAEIVEVNPPAGEVIDAQVNKDKPKRSRRSRRTQE
ncbi:phage nucleotide-binding protein [Clostridium cavendishii DSM 21758]|uniref:Phage nucleotide-binding protein n=1 Tax=Clostridium cavendishii DSM 21758 TaxID=1121302 RepID=A0A1M6S212_9CLOT|nr:AAA family ATPase [Clostridium cavendishii]SHK38577.1 phage nucleotide-binding protein [Clostridium cavendishii DSM 21758]